MAYTPTFGLPVIGTAPDQYATDAGLNGQINAQLQALYDATMHFVGSAGTADLDTLTEAGVYTQFVSTDATIARHYPVSRGGILIVTGGAAVYQTYITPEGAFGRFRTGGVWGTWSGIVIAQGLYSIDATITADVSPDTYVTPGVWRVASSAPGMIALGWPAEGAGAGGTLTVTGITGGVRYQHYSCAQGAFTRYFSAGAWTGWRGVRVSDAGIFETGALNRALGTLDLDDDAAWAAGIYYQASSTAATVERHYPIQRGGILIVAGRAGNTVVQTYVTVDGIAIRYGLIGGYRGAWSIAPSGAALQGVVADWTGRRIVSLGSSTLDYLSEPLADLATRAHLALVDWGYAGDTIQGSGWILGPNTPSITFAGGQIVPGAQTVTVSWPWSESTSPALTRDCVLPNGVTGTLARLTDTTGTFTAAIAASVTVGTAPVLCPVVRAGGERDAILLLNAGKNNLTDVDELDWIYDRVVDLVDYVTAPRRSIVLGYYADTGANSTQRARILDINGRLAARYGQGYLSLLDLMAAPSTWTALGLTKTTADTAALADGCLPPSLSRDAAHLSVAMGPVVAAAIEQRARDLGYLGHLASGAQVDAAVAALTTEVRNGRVWAPLGSLLTPAGLTPPTSTDMIVCRTTGTVQISFWRLELDPTKWPSAATDTEVQDSAGGWWFRVWNSLEATTAAAAVASLTTEVRNGRVWAPSGSLLTPAGLTPPTSTDMIVCRTTGTVRISFWRVEGETFGPASDTLVQTSDGTWWKMIWASDDTSIAALSSAPALMRMQDSTGAAWGVYDQVGGLHLPGLGGVSVQDQIGRTQDMMARQALALRSALHINAVTDLGADRRGRADCAALINAAQAKIARNIAAYGGRAVIYYPEGDFRLDSWIYPYSGISHIGAGRRTVLRPRQWYAALRRTDGTYLEDAMFANFSIDGGAQTRDSAGDINVATKGMYLQGFRRCVFTDLWIENTAMSGLGIDFSDWSIIQRVYARGCGRLPIEAGWLTPPGASGIGIGTGWQEEEPLIIADCLTLENRNYGAFVEKQRASAGANYIARGLVVHGLISRGNQYGFGEAGCDGSIIAASQLNGNSVHGLALHGGTLTGGPLPGRGAIITGNQIRRNGGHGIHWDSSVMHSDRAYTSDGNRIEGNGGAGHHWAGNTGATTDDLVIRGDEIVGNGAEGIWLEQGSLTNCDLIAPRLLGNVGAAIRLDADITGGRIAGATLRDLTATPSQTASITGAGDLTDFDIAEVVAHGASATPINLTGTLTRVTYGRNVGV